MTTIAITRTYDDGSTFTDHTTASDPTEFLPAIAFAQQSLLDRRIVSYEVKLV